MQPHSILCLDSAGAPASWLSTREAAHYVASDLVAWALGESCVTLRGGTNAVTGRQSLLQLPPIIAIRGKAFAVKRPRVPAFNREQLFRRDRHQCIYCGQVFRESELTVEHIVPESRGGATSWRNCAAACKRCNGHKGDRSPEEARMPLLYVPYEPNRFEAFILSNRRILADQQAFLIAGVGADSRLRLNS